MKVDWVLKESVDGMAYQTLDINRLHEKWKVASYGTCIKIISFQQWPTKNVCGSPLVPTPDMMRRQSLSYWGAGPDIPPSEKIVAKVTPPNATELIDRIIANRTRREENLREQSKKKKNKESSNIKILEKEKSGRGFKYLITFNDNDTPKWVIRSQIPKRFSHLVEQFDEAWKVASNHKISPDEKNLNANNDDDSNDTDKENESDNDIEPDNEMDNDNDKGKDNESESDNDNESDNNNDSDNESDNESDNNTDLDTGTNDEC